MLLVGCASAPQQLRGVKRPPSTIDPDLLAPPAATLAGPEGLPSRLVAVLPEGTTRLLSSEHDGETLLVAHAPQGWLGAVVDTRTTNPLVPEQWLLFSSEAGQDALADIRWTGAGHTLVWARGGEGNAELVALEIDAQGAITHPEQVIARSDESSRWVAMLDAGGTPVIVWQTTTATAAPSTLRLSSWRDGVASNPEVIARGVAGWHATGGPNGAAIATIQGDVTAAGTVALVTVDRDGRPSPARTLQPEARASADVQVAALDDRYVVAWTDVGDRAAHINIATANHTATLLAPQPLLPAVDGSALVAIESTGEREQALVVWHDTHGLSPYVKAGLVNRDGKLQSTRLAVHQSMAEGLPQFDGHSRGFNMVTLAVMTLSDGSAPQPMLIAPHVVSTDAELGRVTSEPLRSALFGPTGLPASVHRISCSALPCVALATGTQGEVIALDLVARNNPWSAAFHPLPSAGLPAATHLSVVHELDGGVDALDAVKLADGRTLVAWVTHHTSEEAERGAARTPEGAKLQFVFVAADGSQSEVHTLSERAISIGGVSLAPLPSNVNRINGKRPVAVIGWAGPSKGASQVFVTKIDGTGRKLRQKVVTKIERRSKSNTANEVSDVAIALDGAGNTVLTWSDTRTGNAEIYVARVNPLLEKNKLDQRLTATPGASVEPVIRVKKKQHWLAWSDRQADSTHADIFVQAVDSTTLQPLGAARQLHRSERHSRSPEFSAGANGRIDWIDEGTLDQPSLVYALTMGSTDGASAQTPAKLTAVSRARHCDDAHCKLVFAAADGEALRLYAHPAASAERRLLTTVPGGGFQDALLVATGTLDVVFFVDERSAAPITSIRRLQIAW